MIHPKTIVCAAVAVLALSIAPPATALETIPTQIHRDEDESRAKALEIIGRHIDAIGGEAALRSHRSVTQTGTLTIAAAGLTGEFKAYNRAPNLFSVDVAIPGLGSLKTGYDGEIGWSENPIEGAMVFEGRQLREMSIEADYVSVLSIESNYEGITFEGVKNYAGQQANVVKLVDEEGVESIQHFSVESNLLIGTIASQASAMGEIKVSTELSEYKEFGDLMFATKTVQIVGPQTIEINISDVSFDEIEDDAFVLPPAIQALTEAPEPAAAP